MSIFSVQVHGLRQSSGATLGDFAFNLVLYVVFIAPHLVMTRAWWKRTFWGDPAGSPAERRFYVLFGIAVWWLVIALHRPLPAGELPLPWVVRLAGVTGFLFCFLLFFQGISLAVIDGLLAVPGAPSAFSHGAQTPLYTEGSYAQVRHPMYRAIVLAGLCSLAVHPDWAQLFWVVLIASSFVGFIPVEEAQLIAARGDDYRTYMEKTPYRLFRGVW
jgi:protein-S-isoprenylcysteine O-methyltransferase Ste14